MRHQQLVRPHVIFFGSRIRHQDLVAGVLPAVPLAGVYLVAVEYDPVAPIKLVPHARRIRLPDALNLFSPARFQHLVYVDTDADVNVRGHQRQRHLTRDIEPPRVDVYRVYCCPTFLGNFYRLVC